MRRPLERIERTRKLAAAVVWRGFWKADDKVRSLMWGDRLGFDLRPRPAVGMTVTEPAPAPAGEISPLRLPRDRSAVLGILHGGHPQTDAALLTQIGHFYGLEVHPAEASGADHLIARARRGDWPMVGVTARALRVLPDRALGIVAAFVEAGGTLLLHGAAPDTDNATRRLSEALGCPLPSSHRISGTDAKLVFSATDVRFTQEFAGVMLEPTHAEFALAECPGANVVCRLQAAGETYPAVAEIRAGAGRILIAARGLEVTTLGEGLGPRRLMSALPAMMLVKQVYGPEAWHAPLSFAGFVIDDPALRNGRLGLDYAHVLGLAREYGFHVTVATIPRELGLAEPGVVDLLRRNRRWISACYHGSNHSGYEFYLPQGSRLRYRTRDIPAQDQALERAVERGEAFARRTGLALDRVMVFPHGIGPAPVLRRLQSLGFLAACNFDDRYPLAAAVPDDFDLGLRPADLGWEGFPLMWRRGLNDPMFVLDLFLGRPALTFGHRKSLGPDLEPLVRRAAELHRVAGLQWSSLEDVSRHSYLERRDPTSGWQVTMCSNEICLHNPGDIERTYSVLRPHLPTGYQIEAADHRDDAGGVSHMTVPAGGTRVIRVTSTGATSLTPGRPCSIREHRANRTVPVDSRVRTNAH